MIPLIMFFLFVWGCYIQLIKAGGVFLKHSLRPYHKSDTLLSSWVLARAGHATRWDWVMYSTKSGLQCSVAWLMDSREHQAYKKQWESSNIKVTRGYAAPQVLQLQWLDWIQRHSSVSSRTIHANFQHITTNKATPAAITKTVTISQWNITR